MFCYRIATYCTAILARAITLSIQNCLQKENKIGNGLEAQCIYSVKGPEFIGEREEMLMMDYLKRTT